MLSKFVMEKCPNVEVIAGWKTRDQLINIIHSFDCGVYLPAYEGFGIAALETLAAGKPLITHALSGHSDFIPQNECFMVKCSIVKARGVYESNGFWYELET